MTETEWLTCTNAQAMLSWLQRRASPRKLRLFACACCRRFWYSIPDERSRNAVLIAERFADKEATRSELALARALCPARGPLARASAAAAASSAAHAATLCADEVAGLYCHPSYQKRSKPGKSGYEQLADHVRHLFGNPFRPQPPAEGYSSTILQLAFALYSGEDCAFALHDALLEAGHSDLAEHFQAAWHPKGCWALDHFLGRK